MDKTSNSYVVGFAVVVCAAFAIVLATTYNLVKDKIAVNELLDQQKNVLIAVWLHSHGESRSDQELIKLFEERIQGTVLEVRRGPLERRVKERGEVRTETVDAVLELTETEHPVKELAALQKAESKKPDPATRREFVPIYRRVSASGETEGWAIPISGYGLWSTLYGFLALEPDLNTVKGITFYRHGETPGLGGEVDNLQWQEQWRGKHILDESGQVVGVQLKKGTVDSQIPWEKDHMVDGLSGATITSNGVNRFVLADLQLYEPYFAKQRQS